MKIPAHMIAAALSLIVLPGVSGAGLSAQSSDAVAAHTMSMRVQTGQD